MKKLFLIFLITLCATPALSFTDSFGAEHDRIVKIFQSEDESDAMDAFWETKTLLKIGVFNHGNHYDEYANHACEIIEKNGFEGKAVVVQVIDLKKLAEAEEWVVLGKAQCR